MAQLPDDLDHRVRGVLAGRLQGGALLAIDHMGTITEQDRKFAYATVHPGDRAALDAILTRAEQARQAGLADSYELAWDYAQSMTDSLEATAFLSLKLRYGAHPAPWTVFMFELPRWAAGLNAIYVLKSLFLTDKPLSGPPTGSLFATIARLPPSTFDLALALCAQQGVRVLPIRFAERVPELAQIIAFLREDGFLPGSEG